MLLRFHFELAAARESAAEVIERLGRRAAECG
jgi:hypothetical protein